MRKLGANEWADEAGAIVDSTAKIESPVKWPGSKLYSGSIYGYQTSTDNYAEELSVAPGLADSALFVSTVGESVAGFDCVFANDAEKISRLVSEIKEAFSCVVIGPVFPLVLGDESGSLADALSYLRGEWRNNSKYPPVILLDPDMREGHSDARFVLPKFCDRMIFS
jgi:hypothetical protein